MYVSMGYGMEFVRIGGEGESYPLFTIMFYFSVFLLFCIFRKDPGVATEDKAQVKYGQGIVHLS